MSSAAIRAGQAFVEMLVKDESVQRSLVDLKMKFAAFGATVNSIGSQAFSTLNNASTLALGATSASAAAATAGTSLVASAVYATTNAFRVLFMTITAGVGRAAVSMRLVGYIVRDIFPKGGMVQRAFDSFLNSSVTIEKAGRWGRLVGAITGSSFIRGMGVRLERMGMSAAIERGVRDGGFAGWMRAYIGAGFRSVPSFITGVVASGITAPFRAAFGVIRGGASATAQSIATVSSVTGGVSAAIAKATTPTRSFAGAALSLASVFPRITMAAAGLGGIASVITAPAILAAKGFASAADEIVSKSKETGQSIRYLIQEKYGTFSFIKPEDIEAGAKMSQAMKEMKQQIAAAFAQIGIAALPVLRSMTEFMKNVMAVTTRYISENRQLISAAIMTAAKIGSIAAAVAAVGAAFPTIVTAVGALLSPIGLVAVAVGGLVYLFPQIRQAAADAFNFLFPNFGELLSIVNRTMAGIFDALQGGSIAAAAEVLWSGLELAWMLGTERLREIVRPIWAEFRAAWVVTAKFIGDVWQNVVAGMKSVWTSAQNAISNGLARLVARMSGQDVSDVLATLNEMQGEQSKAASMEFSNSMKEREKAAANALLGIDEDVRNSGEAFSKQLEAARKRFDDATKSARTLKENAIASQAAKAVQATKSLSSGLSGGFGSFSAATAKLQGVSGLGKLEEYSERTAKASEETVAKLGKMEGLVYT